jgi:hypothetical protein
MKKLRYKIYKQTIYWHNVRYDEELPIVGRMLLIACGGDTFFGKYNGDGSWVGEHDFLVPKKITAWAYYSTPDFTLENS